MSWTGRPLNPELIGADREARRYVLSLLSEYRRIGYPAQSAFAKEMSRGTVAGLTPEDPFMDAIGAFMWSLAEPDRQLVMAHYGEPEAISAKAKRFGISIGRYYRTLHRVLINLKLRLEAT